MAEPDPTREHDSTEPVSFAYLLAEELSEVERLRKKRRWEHPTPSPRGRQRLVRACLRIDSKLQA
jgi:hypothetical protein